MIYLYLFLSVFVAHFLAAFLHYHTVLRDSISREKLEIILMVFGFFVIIVLMLPRL